MNKQKISITVSKQSSEFLETVANKSYFIDKLIKKYIEEFDSKENPHLDLRIFK